MPSPTEFDSYGDSYADVVERSIAFSGADHTFFTQAKVRELLRIAGERLGDPARLAVLDIGCGPGATDLMLEGRVASLAGTDPSVAMVEAARSRNPWAEYRVQEAGVELPFADRSFDLAFAICVLHHVEAAQRPALIAEAVRVTRPGGAVAVFEHNPFNPLTRRAVADCEFDRDAVLLRRGESQRLLSRAGLTDVEGAYVVFFTRQSARLELIERRLGRLPLGAQYVVSARRP